jgi:hypothetical protein
MSRLPAPLRPWWPLFKRVHRLLTLTLGFGYRRLARLLGDRGVPRSATTRSVDTAREEPGAVTVHPGGPAEQVHRELPAGDPPGHWRFRQAATAQVPARYVLEVAGGRITGDFGATVTPGHVLDYQTSGYFGISSWREHPLFLKPTLGRIERVPGTVLSLTTRGTATNYYHFLYDALGRYAIFEEALPDEAVDAVVVPHRLSFQGALLELAGVRARLIEPANGVTVAAERLLVPSTPNQDLAAPPWVVAWLRRRLLPTTTAQPARRLYLTRGDQPNTRRFVQEEELWPWLERHGFLRIDPGKFPVQEQIDLFRSAEVVVGPHGAALTNITFCRPGTSVLELFAPSYVHQGLSAIAAAVGGIDYRYLVGDGDHRPGRRMEGNYADVSIPVRRVQEAVEGMLAAG